MAYTPRSCHIIKRADFSGFGFDLLAEKGRAGHYIGEVDDNSPAKSAGLKENDRVIEVNGSNIEHEYHNQVVMMIKAGGDDTKLLVVDPETDNHYKRRGITVSSSMSETKFLLSNRSFHNSTNTAKSFKLSSDEARHSAESSSFQLSSDDANESSMLSFYLSSDEVQEVCDPRTIDNEVVFYCQECKEFLCGDCREFHRKTLMTKKHLVSRIEMRKAVFCQNCIDNELSKHLSRTTVSRQVAAGQTMVPLKPFTTATLTSQVYASIYDEKKPCNIRGVLVADNQIYVADYNNGQIKLFDIIGQALAQYAEPNAHDIASIGKDRIAFTSVGLYFTIIDTAGNKLKHVKKVTTNVNTRGICCFNRLIYVSCFNQNNPIMLPQIQIFTTEGELTRRVEPLLDGKRIFQEPNYITFNQHNSTIYVSDKVGVIALSSAGKVQLVRQVFNRTETSQGISIDDQGHVYICGWNSNNVMKMSADGSDVSEILNKESAYARAIEIVGNQLYLCCHNTDIIRVFTLS